jgi:signal transduction histidine kinase
MRISRLGVWLYLLLLAGIAQAQTLSLTQAAAVTSDGISFPTGAVTRLQQLPDDWAISRPGYSGAVWYRLEFDAALLPLDEALGLYLDRVCSGYQLIVNGVKLRSSGAMQRLLSTPCYAAQVVEIPVGVLRPQGNVLDIRVSGHALHRVNSEQRAAGLSVLELGRVDVLLKRQLKSNLWSQAVPAVLAIMLTGLALLAAIYALISKRERHLGYFAGTAFFTALLTARFFLPDTALEHYLSEWLLASLVPCLLLCIVQFLLRHMHWQHRALDIALVLQCLLLPLSLWWAGPMHHHALASAWFLVLSGQASLAMGFHLWLAWHAQRHEFWPMALILGMTLALLAVELLGQHHELADAVHAVTIAAPLVILLIALRLTVLQAQVRNRAELERVGIEHRIRDTVSEIERNYAQLAEAKVEQVTERERKRIAADLHDDLGAKLLTIVHTSESDRISTLAREALEEMRLSVRGLTGKPVQLLDALGDWRAEVVSRLGQANIAAEWRAPSEDIAHTLPARAYVQTTRIMREAVSNMIKHSGATHCTISCAVVGTDFQVMIQDNGNGISLELDGRLDRGHGMASMKSRAKQMHGQCLVESGPGWGTVIRLTIPL